MSRGPDHEANAQSASDGADSAGQPWAGRRFHESPTAADDGSAPVALAMALDRFRAGIGGAAEVVDAIRDIRLLIPLVAELAEAGVNEAQLTVDKSQELSIVTVQGPDGRAVLPAFSSVEALGVWNADARPVPVDGRRVALAAVQEQTELIVLDPTSETEFALRRPAVWALAQDAPWSPSYADPDVLLAFEASIATELTVQSVTLEPGDPASRLLGPELVVALELGNGLTREELDAVTARLARRWAANDVIATRVDSLTVRLLAAR